MSKSIKVSLKIRKVIDMKQVFYSELLNKYYDTEKDCKKAEQEYEEAKKKDELTKAQVSKEKKALADEVEKAEHELNSAYHDLEVAYKEADKLINDTRVEARKIISEAKNKVNMAQKEKYQALSKFNEKFGAYTTIYSGDKALEELRRMNSWTNSIFGGFFF